MRIWFGAVCAVWIALSSGALADDAYFISAHRSAEMGGHPENSLAWIEYAIGLGVSSIHINPQLTRDDRYVLMHDPTLNRTTDVEAVLPEGPPGGPTREQRGGKDYVRDYTLDEIRTLRLADGQAVPTLEEALDLAEGRIIVSLGLKGYEVESLAQALDGRETDGLLLKELYYSGTDQSKLRALADRTGIGVRAALFRSRDHLKDFEGLFAQIGPALKWVGADAKRLTPEFVDRATDLEVGIYISGWDAGEDFALRMEGDVGPWKAILDQGFGASTDQPELLLDALGI